MDESLIAENQGGYQHQSIACEDIVGSFPSEGSSSDEESTSSEIELPGPPPESVLEEIERESDWKRLLDSGKRRCSKVLFKQSHSV
ncbi:hypothetical protein KIPB_010641 [Kipferlia bialata]|uniref:Uncharacterized protein n=1 Tax=Kipferlia bialata TaxID=797122 RepID=A0A391P621_9EUKA|nr:hypothetical protein KIPB_010641 [Kipferlia bialata]|eukprot:g10641.t1